MVRPEVTSPVEDQLALRADDLHKKFGAVTALAGVSFSIRTGEFVTLLGPSGCGKSTILRILAGIETPTRGAVAIGGKVVNDTERRILVQPERRDLSMVFQSYAVWPHMSVAANVAFPLRYRKVPRSERRGRVTEALRAVRMEEYVDRYPAPALGRAAAAGGGGPLHRGPSRPAAARRAAVEPRRPPARGHAGRAETAPPGAGADHAVRDPRPVRGAGHVGPDPGDGPRAGAAGGHPRGGLPVAGVADGGPLPGREEHRRRNGGRQTAWSRP